ncbi:S24 family peptidase [Flavobacterium sp. UBA6135]|uniref:S24 family peptidase n=1 Tax=Flavobacterium sp. UBA6135 TaxID=1946553 RepID=UPI0025B99DDB|nr:S24 family peptidase [Flavobacterium sp. UBA6135]
MTRLDFIITVKEKLGISFETLLESTTGNELMQVNESAPTNEYAKQEIIPVFDIEKSGGLKKLLTSTKKSRHKIGYLSFPNAPTCDGAVIATGEGMYPLIKSGDFLAYKKVEANSNQIFYGEMYLISLTIDNEEYVTFKYLQKSNTNPDNVLLVSYNQNFQTKEIPFASITALALIKATVTSASMM